MYRHTQYELLLLLNSGACLHLCLVLVHKSVWWDPAPKLHTCSNSPSPAYEADGSKMGSLRPLTTQSPAPSLKQRPENMPRTWVKVQARMMRSNVKFSGRQRRLPPSYLPPFSPERLTQFSIPSEIVVPWIFASRKAVYSRGSPSCSFHAPAVAWRYEISASIRVSWCSGKTFEINGYFRHLRRWGKLTVSYIILN